MRNAWCGSSSHRFGLLFKSPFAGIARLLFSMWRFHAGVIFSCAAGLLNVGDLPAQPVKDWPEPARVVRLWADDAPGLVPPVPPEEIVAQRIKNVSSPELWVYPPDGRQQNRAALVICPGGGYVHLAMGLHVGNVVKLFNDKGVVIYGLKYRTRYGGNDVADDAAADCARAVRLIRHHAKEWGIDPSRIGVQGYSAGANVGLNLLGRYDNGDPKAADPVDRISSRPDFVALMCLWPDGRKPEAYPIRENPPPVFIAAAEDDQTAPIAFSRAIEEKLKAQGGRVIFFKVPIGGHGAFHYDVSKGPGVKWPEVFLPMIPKAGS